MSKRPADTEKPVSKKQKQLIDAIHAIADGIPQFDATEIAGAIQEKDMYSVQDETFRIGFTAIDNRLGQLADLISDSDGNSSLRTISSCLCDIASSPLFNDDTVKEMKSAMAEQNRNLSAISWQLSRIANHFEGLT